MDWNGFVGGLPPARKEILLSEAMERSIQQVDASILARSGKIMLPVIGQTVQIDYQDAAGQSSSRRINVTRVRDHDGHRYIDAWCHERSAPRCFRCDRIIAVIDMITGEVFPGFSAWRDSLRISATEGEEEDQADRWPEVLDGATVLMFLARHDGHVTRDEKRAVAEYIHHRVAGASAGEASRCVRLALGMFPTSIELAEALVRLRSIDQPARHMIMAAGQQITDVNVKLLDLITQTLS